MLRSSLPSSRRTLALVLVLGTGVLAACWTGIGYHLESRQDLAVDQVRRDVSNLAIALEEQIRRSIVSVNQIIDLTEGEFNENPQTFDLKSWAARSGSIDWRSVGIVIADPEGRIVSTTAQEPGGFASLPQSPSFRQHLAAGEAPRLRIDRPVRIDGSGRWKIVLSRPLMRADRSIAGVIFVTIDAAALARSFPALDVGANGFVSLYHADGFILARWPIRPGMFERNDERESHARARHQSLSGHPGKPSVFERPNLTDGQERITAYRPLADAPLIVGVGKSVEEALAPLRQDRRGILGAGVLFSLALLVGIALLIRELSKRRRRENELAVANAALAHEKNRFRQSSAILQATLDNMDQGLMMVDASGIVQVCNRRACSLLSLQPGCMAAQPRLSDLLRTRPDLVVLQPTAEAYQRCEHDLPNGTAIEIIVLRQSDGAVILTCTDITARRLAEQATRDSEERYRLLAENASDIIALHTLGPRGRVVYVSPACERVLGYAPAEMIALAPEAIVHPDDIAGVRLMLKSLKRGEASRTALYRLRHRDGRWIWVEAVTQIVEGAAVPTAISSIRDVTQRQEQAEELVVARDIAELALAQARHASQAKSDFLATMSHEIRTPLNGILGYADLLAEDDSLKAEHRRYAERIQSAGSALLTVVNDVLDFSKIEAGQVELDPAPFSPIVLVDNAVSIVSQLASQKRLELRLDVDPTIPNGLQGDEARIRQILLNLLNNAIKFTSTGYVALNVTRSALSEEGATLRFDITDTGPGIPADKLDRLFKRFSQVDRSVKRQFGGSGLGLAISKRLVEMMGGQIGVRSEEGEGSTFWFTLTLPLATVEANAESAPAISSRAAIPARILLAEDVEINQDLACRILRGAGHEVDVVADGAAAVMAVQARIYDLVLMDVQMPGMDGVTATERIRALSHPARTIPIIAMTANVLPKQVAAFKAAGMNDHVGKPFKREKLLAAVDRWLSDIITFETPSTASKPMPISDDSFNRTIYDDLAALVGAQITEWHAKLREQLDSEWLSGTATASDLGRTASAAHVVVSTAGMLGFMTLSASASELETACLSGERVEEPARRFAQAREAALERLDCLEMNRARDLKAVGA